MNASPDSDPRHNLNQDLYRALFQIRAFEETVLREFSRGVFFGTTHTYLGQEANAVGVAHHLHPTDVVISNHRCHGHFLARGGDPRALFAELMGKASGVSGGRGGSQHLHWANFYSNGVLGGTLPLAVGMALAEQRQGRDSVTVVFLGDGALGEGQVYESFNLAQLWGAPVLFVIEDNGIAQTTPTRAALAGGIALRLQAFGIPAAELDSSDVLEIGPAAAGCIAAVRETRTPRGLILHTARFGPHSKGDDTRPAAEVEQLKAERDPLRIQAERVPADELAGIETAVQAEIRQAFEQALADPFPQLEP